MSLVAAWAIVKRHRRLFTLTFVTVVVAGIAYAALARPQYTATSVVLIDTRSKNPGQQSAASSAAVESANVDSQVEVLRSEGVIRSVVTALDLTEDPEFAPRPLWLVQWLRAQAKDWFGLDLEALKTDPTMFAIGVMEKNIVVKRLGLSYVVQLDYKSTRAVRAAEIANKLVERYIATQVEGRQAAEASFSEWLQRRTAALRDDAVQTEQAFTDRKLAEAKDRIARAYASGDEAPPAGEAALRQSLDRSAAEMAQAARESADLKEFESAAQISRAMAETFARRLAEFAPQTAGALSEARVISRALPPQEKSEPKVLLVVGAAIALGALCGFGAAALRENTLKGLRSPAQFEAETGLPCFGTLAHVADASRRRPRAGTPRSAEAALLRHGLDRPASSFAETLRTIRTGIRTPTAVRPAQTIGVVSALGGEGKSVVSANLGHVCAATGVRTLLIDLNLRRGGVSRHLAPAPQWGVADVIAGSRPVSDVIRQDPDSGLMVLPAVALPPADAFGLLSSTAMAQFIGVIAQQFDLVILDLPAILPTADALALAPAVDSYILVVAWGATEAGQVAQAMRKMPDVSERLLGAVLSGAPSEPQGVADAPGLRKSCENAIDHRA